MQEIHVRALFDAPVARVFEAVSDHERFLSAGRTRAVVIKPGSPDRNGAGCLREVRGGGRLRFVEEVTAWEPPSAYEYMIRECSLPVVHHGGRLSLTPQGGGTVVEWTSRFEIPMPLVGGVVASVARRILAKTFSDFLLRAKKRVEGGGAK